MANLRIHLANTLREAREAGNLTQEYVAMRLRCSLFRVKAIEGGETPIYEDELDLLLVDLPNAYIAHIRELFEAALMAEPVEWFDEPRYRDYLNVVTSQMLGIESRAANIRIFQPNLIPGLLQTGEYTGAVVSTWDATVTDERGRLLREIRMRRKNAVFGKPEPPEVRVLIEESVLLRVVGNARVMAEQLDALLDYATQPRLDIRILPNVQAGQGTPFGHFIIFDQDNAESLAVYRERESDDVLDEKPQSTAECALRFENLWAKAWSEAASIDYIRACVRALRGESMPMTT